MPLVYPTCCISTALPLPNRWEMGWIYHRDPQLWVLVGQWFIKYQCAGNKDSLSSTSDTCMDSSTITVSKLSSQYVMLQQGPQWPAQTDIWTQFCHTHQCGKISRTAIPQQLGSANYNCNSTGGTILSHSGSFTTNILSRLKRPNTAALYRILTSQAHRPLSTLLSYFGMVRIPPLTGHIDYQCKRITGSLTIDAVAHHKQAIVAHTLIQAQW
jgi:hypothetical protein